ncbi:reverse transcriptase domain-containing protein, partial [Tanacetum coccineum]
MTLEVIEELINQRVAEALAAQEANCNIGPIVGSENQYEDEEGDNNGGGNGNGNGGGNGNHGNENRNGMNGGAGGNAPVARGLPDNIQGNVTSSKPTRLQDAIKMANGSNVVHQNQDSNVIMGTFLLNNRYASMLFDSGADGSFVSIAFSSLIDIAPTTLDYSYVVELAYGRVAKSSTILRGCTLNLLNHPFNIDLMPVELGSFDIIIGMDWLLKYHVVIVCDEKVIGIPYGNEVLTIHGDGSDKRSKSKLSIISYTKTQKYIQK